MTNQGERQAFWRAINGSSSDYNSDFLDAAASEGFTSEFNGVFIRWLQNRTGSSSTNLDGLKAEFAALVDVRSWNEVGATPLLLPDLELWLDASDSSTITESSGLVSQWNDKTSNGNNVTQGTGADQPTTGLRTSNGKNTLDFTLDSLDFPSAMFSIPNGENTVFIVAAQDTPISGSDERIIQMNDAGSNRWYVQYNSASNSATYRSGAPSGAPAIVYDTMEWAVLHGRREGTTMYVAVNGGTEISAGSAIAFTAIGGGISQSNVNAAIAEVLVYSRNLTTAEIAQVNSYLINKWINFSAPTDLEGLQLWLDASDSDTITESSGLVSAWADKSGNGLSGTATGTERPTTGTSTIGGLNALSFDGGDFLNLGQPASLDFTPGTDEFEIFAVCDVDTNNTGAILSKSGSSSSLRQYHLIYNANVITAIIGGTTTNYSTTATGAPHSYDLAVSTSDQELFFDGSSDGTGSIGTATNANDVLVGARRATDVNTGSAFLLTGRIGEIIVYDRKLSISERIDVNEYLDSKWSLSNSQPYDVIALMGQSNMAGWFGPVDATLDASDIRIRQWGRNPPNNNTPFLAHDQLDHVDNPNNTIGLGMTFAKAHLATMPSGRRVLVVPVAAGSTGFSTGDWNPGDALYEDSLARINAAVASVTGSVLTHILWNQGEADRAWTEEQYATALDAMIADLRSRATGAATVPFVCGGTLVGGVHTSAGVSAALLDTPNRNTDAFYASSVGLTDGGDNNHFSAVSLRTFGQRYFDAI